MIMPNFINLLTLKQGPLQYPVEARPWTPRVKGYRLYKQHFLDYHRSSPSSQYVSACIVAINPWLNIHIEQLYSDVVCFDSL